MIRNGHVANIIRKTIKDLYRGVSVESNCVLAASTLSLSMHIKKMVIKAPNDQYSKVVIYNIFPHILDRDWET